MNGPIWSRQEKAASDQPLGIFLMTGFTSILGVFPLVIASGARAASRQALGTAVFGGMIATTCLMVLFVPAFYVVIERMRERLRCARGVREDETGQGAPAPSRRVVAPHWIERERAPH